jgi:hypothetical protein
MTREEFVNAALKLIGVACLVIAVDYCGVAVTSLAAIGFSGGLLSTSDAWYVGLLIRPVAYLFAAYLLLFKTQWCESCSPLRSE